MQRLRLLLNEIAVCFSRTYLPFSTRLLILCSFYFLRIRRGFAKKTADGVPFLGLKLHAGSYDNLITIVREVFVYGDYYFKATTDQPHIIDCGGNIGISTLFFKWLYPNASVTVFEPVPQNIESLRKNVELNGLKNVLIVEAAASDHDGTLKFWEDAKKPGSSTAIEEVSTAKAKPGRTFVEYEVQAKKLSDFVGERVDFLKMDIEGGEGIVIKELAESRALSKIRSIVMEYHLNPKNTTNRFSDLISRLEENGFHWVVFGNEIGPTSEDLARQNGSHFLFRAFRT